MPIIRTENVVKEFQVRKPGKGKFSSLRSFVRPEYYTKRAVDNISFAIEAGEIVGYVGANGAGKSTTIKMLTGILMPTSGTIEVVNVNPWQQRKQTSHNIGVVFGQRSHLWWDLPLIESFVLISKIYEIPREKYQRNIENFIDLLDMTTFIETPVRQLSLGQRMRGDLVAAMLYEPAILYLDEPTIGLDILAKERILTFIEAINRTKNVTILLTTHDLDDVERLCSRIILIDQGRIIYDGSVQELKKKYTTSHTLMLQLETSEEEIEVTNAVVVSAQGKQVWLEYDPARVSVASLISSLNQRYPITALSVIEPELETVIRKIYGKNSEEI